ncbi:hypothetical protein PILCRDRAFT_11100 [Piloderma croceum F 1598]|uniref:NACHT domain-containing protein n=1 Tax=Piloderma croceum (strain F 1598) TaxID=765440 RepID=A0A0C3AXA9_PILCF|nr:hypothetical protein PILCRDRAFT_11100 [Piloderma croceum F 1598]
MQDSSHDDPRFSRGALNINAKGGIFNQVGRDQYNQHYNNYNNPMNNEMVADAYLAKLPCAVRAGYSSGNHKPCLKGTREGVLWDIEAWEADEMNESVYWLKGVAGCGKSTIAQTFAERSGAKGNLGASFFCSRDYSDRRNLHLIFLTLARDLAYWSADFKTALVPIIRVNPNVQDDSLPVQLEKLLVRPFKQTGLSATIVVDALDECEDKEPVSEFLSALAVHVDSMPMVRFFITGRPEDRVRSGFKLPSLRTKELPLHDVDSATVNSDIKSSVTFRLNEIATRRTQSINGHWPSDRDIAVILKKTSGLFIIASVILRFIDSSVASPQKRLKLIVDPPESTIYEGRSGIDVRFFDRLHLVVGSIVLALKPLPHASLAEILEMTPEDIWIILTHLHSVLIVPESESEPIRILHKSFADFITDKERCPDARHFIDAPPHHSVLGILCLKLMKMRLMKNICGFPRYAMNNNVKDLPARRELCIAVPLSYACSSWAKHIQLSSQAGGSTSSVLTQVNEFFTHHLLSWLEVLSIEEHLHTAIYSLHDVRLWLTENPNQDLSDLIDNCERFVLWSFDGVMLSAMQIYHSALSWTPTSSSIRQLYERKMMTETKLVNAVSPTWDACIRIIPVAVGGTVRAVAFSPSGALIAGCGECAVKVFDAKTGMNRATFDEHKFITSVAFSHDDGFLAAGLWGRTINLWDVQTGTIFRAIKWTVPSSPYSVAFSSCRTMIASSINDGTV